MKEEDRIRDDEELAVVQEQQSKIQRALEHLRRDLEAANPRNFAIYSEGYVDQIAELQELIDDYAARKNASATSMIPALPPVDAAKEPLH